MEDQLRATGRTSRLVDSYIQELFTNKEIEVRDHFPHRGADKFLLKRIIDRYNNEYDRGHQKLVIKNLNVKLVSLQYGEY